jgi:hypothetical protein
MDTDVICRPRSESPESAMATTERQRQVDANYARFQEMLPKLIHIHAGKYAVMRDGEIVGFYDTFRDALRFAYSKFGEGEFSVQEVTRPNVSLGYHSYALCQSANN